MKENNRRILALRIAGIHLIDPFDVVDLPVVQDGKLTLLPSEAWLKLLENPAVKAAYDKEK